MKTDREEKKRKFTQPKKSKAKQVFTVLLAL